MLLHVGFHQLRKLAYIHCVILYTVSFHPFLSLSLDIALPHTNTRHGVASEGSANTRAVIPLQDIYMQ